jgi:hypothetical protein
MLRLLSPLLTVLERLFLRFFFGVGIIASLVASCASGLRMGGGENYGSNKNESDYKQRLHVCVLVAAR